MLAEFFLDNWAHFRIILEAGGLLDCPILQHELYERYIMGVHGKVNTHQAIYVTGPRDDTTGTKLRILKESSNKSCPWTAFEVQFAKEYSFDNQIDFADSQLGKKEQSEEDQKGQSSHRLAYASR